MTAHIKRCGLIGHCPYPRVYSYYLLNAFFGIAHLKEKMWPGDLKFWIFKAILSIECVFPEKWDNLIMMMWLVNIHTSIHTYAHVQTNFSITSPEEEF